MTDEPCEKIRRVLGRAHLPALPASASYLLTKLSDDTLDYRRLSAVLEGVPTIAVRILGLANSAWVSPVTPVTSLDTACGLLGLGIVRSVSVALAVGSPFSSSRCPVFDPVRFWQGALLTAETASSLCERLEPGPRHSVDAPTVRTAGLLQHLGLVWMADSLAEPTQAALERVQRDPAVVLLDALREEAGVGYDDAGAFLARAWGLPPVLRAAMSCQHAGSEASLTIHLVAAAGNLVSALLADRDRQPALSRLASLGLKEQVLLAVDHHLEDSAAHVHDLAVNVFANARPSRRPTAVA